MTSRRTVGISSIATLLFGLAAVTASSTQLDDAHGKTNGEAIPNTGQRITPLLPRGAKFEPLNPGLKDFPQYAAGQAVSMVVSPDKKTLLILTSGYNRLNPASGRRSGQRANTDSNEYVFVFDIANKIPSQSQVLQVPNTYAGIAFDPNGRTFYVTGGVDDNIHIFDLTTSGWAQRAGSPIQLGHKTGLGLDVKPEAAGIALTADGGKLAVANYYNDSISVLTRQGSTWSTPVELDLRPGKIDARNKGVPGGEYPLWVSIKGSTTAYVSSLRDREIDVVNIGSATPALISRIKLKGQPNKMVLNASQSTLFVAEDETDSVAMIDTARDQVLAEISASAPSGLLPSTRSGFTGNNTNGLALSPDESTLYVTNGNTNDVAVISISARSVSGLIPTGWYPNAVSLSGDGSFLYVVNGKSPTGPNSGNCHGNVKAGKSSAECSATNQYDLQLAKAGFQSMPTPQASQLPGLTEQVAANNNFLRTESPEDKAMMAALRSKIEHVIYIVKENRTYDQVLGDLDRGNGDPRLTEFGETITPNLHAIARNFVTLDNFYDRSEVSMDGWPWSTSARAPDVVEKQVTVNYAGRGLSYDSEGTNRNVNVAYPDQAQRLKANPLTPADPDVLPGTVDVAAPDGPNDEPNGGYLWNAAIRAGLTLRNYGFFLDLARYNLPAPYTSKSIPELKNPFASKTQVAYPADSALAPYTDPYFRGFDNSMPDYYRFTEWRREFTTTYAHGNLPKLSLVRLMHDHTGSFGTAIARVNTPELQVADNDYAVGLLIQTVARSQYKGNTLIFVIEDDSQDGGDHVDAHRSIAFVAGPYVKHGAVVSTSYNTVDFIRTMEEVLGLPPLNLNDSVAVPMADIFDLQQSQWSYTASASPMLARTDLPLPASSKKAAKAAVPTHDAAYWARITRRMDFSAEDRIDFDSYNHILWQGLMGDRPYPETVSGVDLRENRTELLKQYREQRNGAPAQGRSNTNTGAAKPAGSY